MILHGPYPCSSSLWKLSQCRQRLAPRNSPMRTEGLVNYFWTYSSPSVFIPFIPHTWSGLIPFLAPWGASLHCWHSLPSRFLHTPSGCLMLFQIVAWSPPVRTKDSKRKEVISNFWAVPWNFWAPFPLGLPQVDFCPVQIPSWELH